jgi:hypothetical protein
MEDGTRCEAFLDTRMAEREGGLLGPDRTLPLRQTRGEIWQDWHYFGVWRRMGPLR